MSEGNDRYLNYGRWDEYRRATDARIAHLEGEIAAWQTREEATKSEHRTRNWQVVLAVMTGLVLPLLVIGTIALIHLITKS